MQSSSWRGFSGWLHADGYQGYHRLPEQIRCGGVLCPLPGASLTKALTAVPKEQQSASKPAEALCYFAKLFQMEQDFAPLTVEERFANASGAGKTCFGGSVGMGKLR